ncbi:hypothetical protein DID88_006118 [Monilinia fructigena]|uniref:Uncharacterized protein n=1 Tax=Monilinia fructigena TaxID=38457 RepID=A0A395J1P7_9HELO|nr:hypothetical protein DID88_006118 [Monilinia fructigena]
MGSFAAMTLYQANPSDVSLVPYLFGSPYSPLNLSLGQSMMRELGFTKTYSASGAVPRDDFPYCEAFEDLLLTSQGRDAEVRTGGLKSTTIEASENIVKGNVTSSQDLASSASRLKGLLKDAETEEQMYEKFPTDASTSPDQFFTTLESALTAVEKLMKGKNVTFEEPRQSNPSSVNGVDISEKQNPQSTESKREVSSSSTVEHYTNEDGSVETTIRVWKRFADGTETETSSSHTVEKATRQRDLAKTDFDLERFDPSLGGANDDQKNKSRTKKNAKSGWFWN